MPQSSIEEVRKRLAEISPDLRPIDQLLQMAGLLVLAMEGEGLRPIVVGGAAVAIYTARSESTLDVDFVVEGARLAAVEIIEQLGFVSAPSRGVWLHPTLRIPVEIPDNKLDGDPERITRVDLPGGLKAYVIGIEDLILDRVDQAFAQESPSSDVRRQALLLLGAHWEKLDWKYLRRESKQRGTLAYLEGLQREVKKLGR